jgi:hypothetical protein
VEGQAVLGPGKGTIELDAAAGESKKKMEKYA